MTLNHIDVSKINLEKLNQLVAYAKNTTKDDNIKNFNFLHVDFDPKRATNTQAPDEESNLAKERMLKVKEYLNLIGFSEPIVSFSGNGYNLDYRIDFPNITENANLLSNVLKALSSKFSDDVVDIDVTTYNASRIIKLFGCQSCKGENTAERPHRYTKILNIPEEIQLTDINILKEFVNTNMISNTTSIVPVTQSNESVSTKSKVVKINNVTRWLDHYGISYRFEKKYQNGDMYLLDICPFNNEHTCSFIEHFNDDNVMFKCHHNSCAEKTIHDFMNIYPLLSNKFPYITKDPDKMTNNETMLNLLGDNIDFILADDNTEYIKYENKVVTLDSSQLDDIIRDIGIDNQIIISQNNVTTIKGMLKPIFNRCKTRHSVCKRVLAKGDALYYSFSPDYAIEIKDGNINQYTGNDVYFTFNNLFNEQTIPDFSSSAEDLPNLVRRAFNINEDDILLFLAQLVCFYIPNISTPILVLKGSHGTSKTTTSKKIKSLVDPTSTEITSMSNNESDLIATLSSGYITAFDNIDRISNTTSDLLCIACTGGNATKRKLYTDNELCSIKLDSKIILNGIGDIISKSDLVERSNIIELRPLTTRCTDKKVCREFENIKSKILGSIFNTIAKGLLYVDDIENTIEELPRMADFCVYGASFIKAMGLNENEFVKKYVNSIESSISICTENDNFVAILKPFLESHDGFWEGKPQALFDELVSLSNKSRMRFDVPNASILSRKINQYKEDLKSIGIEVEFGKSTYRTIRLTYLGSAD